MRRGPWCWPTTAPPRGSSWPRAWPTPTRPRDLPMLEAVGFPVAVNPETRLAALARKRGWLVEHWAKAPGGPRPLLPIGPRWQNERWHQMPPGLDAQRSGRRGEGAADRAQAGPVRRGPAGGTAACRAAAPGRPARAGRRSTRPSCPARAGCGCGPAWPASAAPTWPPSTAPRSRYFEPIVSFPFVPGHEVVGDLDDGRASCSNRCSAAWPAASTRRARACAAGDLGSCERRRLRRPRARAADRLLLPTPAAAGARPWWPTRASSTPCPTP